MAPLLKGTVDAAAFTEFGELVAAKAQGYELTYLDFREWGTPDFAFLNVITTQEFAKANPNTVRAFLSATLEGLSYAAAQPDEAVALYIKAHPELEAGLLLAQWKAAIPDLALGEKRSRLAGRGLLAGAQHMDEGRGPAQGDGGPGSGRHQRLPLAGEVGCRESGSPRPASLLATRRGRWWRAST